jgi:hypothetical protein
MGPMMVETVETMAMARLAEVSGVLPAGSQ